LKKVNTVLKEHMARKPELLSFPQEGTIVLLSEGRARIRAKRE
jgi:hypothetical protein